jgi:hypothetical protein
MALVVAAACSADPRSPTLSAPRDHNQPAHEVAKPMQARLMQLKALIGTDQQAFIERFGIPPEHIRSPAAYEHMKDVTEIYDPEQRDLGPARFYFRNGRLVVIYLADASTIEEREIDAFKRDPADEGTVLRSRAGKTSNLHVYADKGLAVSVDREIDFIEIFQPMTQQEYEQTIYVAPGSFAL